MRIVCLSDTHTRHKRIEVPSGDILIHAGDFTGQGEIWETENFLDWFSKLPHKHKIFIAGNHDYLFEQMPEIARSFIPPSVIYLQDSQTVVEGLRIYGAPWQPRFLNWAFNVDRGLLWKKWAKIPEGIDILVTHGPPSEGLGGVLEDGEDVGDEELLERIKVVKPRLHVSGHIHCGNGKREKYGVTFVNAAICTEEYQPTQKPIVVDLSDK
jgi:predicted phosphohydrolase